MAFQKKGLTRSARLWPRLTDVCTSLWAATLWLKAEIRKEWHLTVRQASRPKWGKTIYLYKNLYMCIQNNTFKTIVLILIILQQKLQTVQLSWCWWLKSNDVILNCFIREKNLTKDGTKMKAIVTRESSGGRYGLGNRKSASFCSIGERGGRARRGKRGGEGERGGQRGTERARGKQWISSYLCECMTENLKYIESRGSA